MALLHSWGHFAIAVVEDIVRIHAARFGGLFRQTRRYQQDLRMSKQEMRDELKEVEGNPLMKARIRRIRRDIARRRMMEKVPNATAVIVNPTHFAEAL